MFLWLALAVGLRADARAAARALALRVSPVERCLFIGDEVSAEAIRAKLSGHGGVNAEGRRASRPRQGRAVVDRLLLRAAPRRDPRPRPDARRAPRDHRPAQRRRRRDAEPRAHAEGRRRARERAAAPARGGGLLGRVRRPARRHRDGGEALRPDALLRRVQTRVRPVRRLAGPPGDLAVPADDRDRDQARQPRPGVLPPAARRAPRPALPHDEVPHDGRRRRRDEGLAARSQRGEGGALQDRRGPARHARRTLLRGAARSTSCRSCSTSSAAR